MAYRNPMRARIRGGRTVRAGAGSASRLTSDTNRDRAKLIQALHVRAPVQSNHVLQTGQSRVSTTQARPRVAAPMRVYAPPKEDLEVASSYDSAESSGDQYDIGSISIDLPEQQTASTSSSASTTHILAPVKADMEAMNANLRSIVGGRHPLLVQAADQIFGAGGKKLRPAIVFLASRATCACTDKRYLCFWHLLPHVSVCTRAHV